MLIRLLILLSLSLTCYAKAYQQGVFSDDIGKYDTPQLKQQVETAIKLCTKLFNDNFIAEDWTFYPVPNQILIDGYSKSRLFGQHEKCRYHLTDGTVNGIKMPSSLNRLDAFEIYQSHK